MPAYAKDSQIVCFFQSAQKFKTQCATLDFSDKAKPLGDSFILYMSFWLEKADRELGSFASSPALWLRRRSLRGGGRPPPGQHSGKR